MLPAATSKITLTISMVGRSNTLYLHIMLAVNNGVNGCPDRDPLINMSWSALLALSLCGQHCRHQTAIGILTYFSRHHDSSGLLTQNILRTVRSEVSSFYVPRQHMPTRIRQMPLIDPWVCWPPLHHRLFHSAVACLICLLTAQGLAWGHPWTMPSTASLF